MDVSRHYLAHIIIHASGRFKCSCGVLSQPSYSLEKPIVKNLFQAFASSIEPNILSLFCYVLSSLFHYHLGRCNSNNVIIISKSKTRKIFAKSGRTESSLCLIYNDDCRHQGNRHTPEKVCGKKIYHVANKQKCSSGPPPFYSIIRSN